MGTPWQKIPKLSANFAGIICCIGCSEVRLSANVSIDSIVTLRVVIGLKNIAMNIDRTEFLAWMERIMNRFDLIGEHIENTQKQRSAVDGEELLDNQDLFMMLKVSARSLQRYRSSGRLPYYTISGKLYYKLSDVNMFIRESFSATSKK